MIWFGLVWFYGISTIVGYLMPNPLYTYVYVFCTQLNGFKYFYLIQIILFTINHLYTQLNGTKYCYALLTIQFNNSHLFTHN